MSGNDDLSALDVREATSVMEVRANDGRVLRHPKAEGEAEGRPFTITLYSIDNYRFVDMARKQTDRRLASRQRQQVPVTAAETERDGIDLLVAVTKSWDIMLDGKVAENKPEAYREAYTRLASLRNQVDEHLGSRLNFSKG